MTVYTWKAEGVVDDLLEGSRKSYGLPPIEWFVRQPLGIKIDTTLEDIVFHAHTRLELLVALEDNLNVDPVLDELTEIIVEAVNTGYSLYRMDYSGTEIQLSRIADVLKE